MGKSSFRLSFYQRVFFSETPFNVTGARHPPPVSHLPFLDCCLMGGEGRKGRGAGILKRTVTDLEFMFALLLKGFLVFYAF